MSKILIKNARIYTMTDLGLIKGEILVEAGKIKEVGETVSAPADAKVINARNRVVTPGLIDAHCHIGMMEDAIGFEGNDVNEAIAPNTAQVRGIDGFNPMDRTVKEALAAGVTSVATGPGSANVIGGTFFACKLHGDCVDEMVIKDPIAMKCALGENPKRVYSGQRKMPSTRMGSAAVMREALVAASNYMKKKEEAAAEGKSAPDLNLTHEAMIPVLKKEIPLKIHAHRADDIFTSIRIVKEFDLDLTMEHCTEGHLIAEKLAKYDYPAVVGPSFGHRSKFELKEKGFNTPGVLNKAGIKVAICTDSPVVPLETLPLMAGMAVAEGMDEYEAMKAITINPAEIIGIEDRVGSLAVGKDADIVIWKKHPFENGAKPTTVIVDGEIVIG